MKIQFPPGFEARMHVQLRQDWDEFRAAHGLAVPVSIRINPAKNQETIENRVPWTGWGKYLAQRPVFTLDPTFHAGAYYVQEASSMFLEQFVNQSMDSSQPHRVLDLCAAPGGKSTHLLSLMGPDSILVSNEVIRSRVTPLSENIQKWGYPNVVVTNNDPEDFQRLRGFFDVILVDAPCSGEGLFRKDPEAMMEWSPENAAICVQRQRRILTDLWPALRQNGVLIYCTCTYNEAENEDHLIWLCRQKGAEAIDLKQKFPGVDEVKKENMTGYRFYPHRVRGEGFFIGAVRKTGQEIPVRKKINTAFATPTRKTSDQLKDWITNPSNLRFIHQDNLILMVPDHPDIEFLSEHLKVITKGTAIATLKHEKLVPEHAVSVSVILSKENFTRINLSAEQALSYLRKDVLNLDQGNRGFALVSYDDLPLGWVNLLGNRMNNLYPSAWKIRMGS